MPKGCANRPHNIKDQRVSFYLPTRVSLVLLIILLCLDLFLSILRFPTISALKSPQEKGSQPRILLERPGGTIPRLSLGSPEHLFKCSPANSLPNIGKIAPFVRIHSKRVTTQQNFPFLSVDHFAIPTVDFQGWAYTGNHKICTPDPITLKPFHPGAEKDEWLFTEEISQRLNRYIFC